MSVPQPVAVVLFSVLVTLSSALPRPFLNFESPAGSSRAPSLTQGPCISSQTTSLDPCSWPRQGSDVPAFNLPWWALVLPPPSARISANTFQSSVASLLDLFRRRWLQVRQWKLPGPAEKTPGSTPLCLARFFSCHVPFPGTFSGIYQPSSPASPVSGTQVPQLQVSVTSFPVTSSASLQTTVSPYQIVQSTARTMPEVQAFMQDWQDAFFWSMKNKMMDILGAAPPQPSMGPAVSPMDYGPWWAAAAGY